MRGGTYEIRWGNADHCTVVFLPMSGQIRAQDDDEKVDLSLVVEEYPIVAASEDTPDHFEFKDRIDPLF